MGNKQSDKKKSDIATQFCDDDTKSLGEPKEIITLTREEFIKILGGERPLLKAMLKKVKYFDGNSNKVAKKYYNAEGKRFRICDYAVGIYRPGHFEARSVAEYYCPTYCPGQLEIYLLNPLDLK